MIHGELAQHPDGEVLIPQAYKTKNALERARGLLGRPKLQAGQALLIDPCSMVHTIGMHYPLDLMFLDNTGRVLKLVRGLKPFRLAGARRAAFTVEMIAGELDRIGIEPGIRLSWRPK